MPRLRKITGILGVLVGMFTLMACSDQPESIVYGQDVCAFCKMGITDPRYAAEIVTRKGRVYKFDSIECMVAATLDGTVDPGEVKRYWVKDWKTQEWVDARKAFYLQSSSLRSPMGLNITAFASRKDLEEVKMTYDGMELLFDDLPNVIRQSNFLRRVREKHKHMMREMQAGMNPSMD